MADPAAPKMAEDELLRMTAEVVSAYVSNNTLATGQLGDVIQSVYNSLRLLEGQAAEPPSEPLRPAVAIRKSVTPDFLICLEDGKHFKSMRRHLTLHGMTPEQYREKWGLGSDYRLSHGGAETEVSCVP